MISLQIVANVPKHPGTPVPDKTASLPFEEALKRLESIVEAMESEDLPLETLLTRYEEGTRLAKTCQEKLAEAEVRIQQLEKDSSGELRIKPLPNDEFKEP
jgi:exodeoxyribonuclease VII small subunit